MGDLYSSYADLAANETEGVDYQIVTVEPAGATWASIAIHGGGIEPGTSEVAEAVAGTEMMFYEFDGMKAPGQNADLHITSTLFDEPQALALVGASRRTLSFHGYTGTLGVAETAIGGLDTTLVARIADALEAKGFTVVDAPSEIAGTDPDNICNKNAISAGVQLEMSRTLRESFFEDFTRDGRKNGPRTQAFTDYVAAIRAAYTGYGVVSLGSINVSRYCLIPAPSADVDLTATVATDALASGGGQFLALVARYQDTSNSYLCRLEFSTTQTVILTLRKRVSGAETFLVQHTTDLTHAAGRRFALRFQVEGSTLRGKTWLADEAEPQAWQLETTDTDLTDAGSIGMRSILSSVYSGALPVVATWGDFAELSGPQLMTVTRSVNGISKSHAAGTDVRLAYPAIVAL